MAVLSQAPQISQMLICTSRLSVRRWRKPFLICQQAMFFWQDFLAEFFGKQLLT
ncbi:MAG: hypothetical protein ACPHVI_04970 [Candidatus Puniceispirillaceae bacterium]